MKKHPRVLLMKLDKPPGGYQQLSYSEPIGICYLAAFLRQHKIDCHLHHCFYDNPMAQLKQVIAEHQPDIVGFSLRCFNYSATLESIRMVQEEFSEIKLALGGEVITAENAIHLAKKTGVDVAFIGDAEHSFLAFVTGKNISRIPALAYRTTNGNYVQTSEYPHCINIARLPMMLRDGLPIDQYRSEAFPGKRYATMHVQRGCRYRCTFCHTANRYDRVSSRTVSQILDEIENLVIRSRVEALAIWDEDFFADLDRVNMIVEGLVERNYPIQWQTFMKLTDLENPALINLLPKLRRSGYIRAVVGLESFLPTTLKNYHKLGRSNPEDICVQLTENDIILCPAYIIGAPHETSDDIAYGLERLRRLRYDHDIMMDLPYVSFITPFPGTGVYEEYSRKGLIIDSDWSHYDGEHVVVRSNCTPEKLVELREQFYEEFDRNTGS